MAPDEKVSMETKKLPPFDQVPDEVKEMPALRRKVVRLDEDKPEPTTVPPWLYMEAGDDEICGMPPMEVFNDLELCNRGCQEFTRQANILNQRVEDIRVALKRIANITHLLSRHQLRLQSMNPVNPNAAVKDFQKRSIERKMERVENIQKILQGGTNIKDLQKAVTIGSPLDNSMKRQGGFGTKRPAPMSIKKASA